MKFDIIKEIVDHIRYFMDISEYGVTLNNEIEKRIPEIVDREEPSLDDFSYLERVKFELSILQMDSMKAASRIRLLYQICISGKMELNLSDEMKKVLDSIVADNTFDFAFYKNTDGRMSFRDKEFEDFISKSCELRVSGESLKEMQQSLKDSFKGYSSRKNMNTDGNKETNTVGH